MSAYYENVGALQNVCTLLKCQRFMKMSALFWNVSALFKSRCSMKKSKLNENVGALHLTRILIKNPLSESGTYDIASDSFQIYFLYSVHCTSSHLSAPGCLNIPARVWDLGLGIFQEILEKCGAFIYFLCAILFFKGAVSRTAFVLKKRWPSQFI